MFTKIRHILCVIVAACVALAGCASLGEKDTRANTAAKVFTQYAVAKYLEKKDSDFTRAKAADNIRGVSRDVLAVIDAQGSADINIPFLKSYALAQINKAGLSPADSLLATSLLDLIVTELSERIGNGTLSPDALVSVKQVLGWIIEACNLLSPAT